MDKEDKMNYDLLEIVKNEFFPSDSPIVIDTSIAGQTIKDGEKDNKIYVIGPWAGPESNIKNLFHEMGHFADRELKALSEYPYKSWGYSFGQPWSVLGQSGYEPQTDQSVHREIKCWAYQYSLELHYGINISVDEVVDSATWLPAFCMYRRDLNNLPYGEKQDSAKLKAVADQVKKLSETTHDIQSFKKQWFDRISFLKAA